MLLSIVEYLEPIVPQVNGFVGKRTPPSMIPMIVIMNHLYYPPSLFGSEASQVWVRV